MRVVKIGSQIECMDLCNPFQFSFLCCSFRSIENTQLDAVVNQIVTHHPAAGEVMVRGHLKSKDILVSRQRLRESLSRVDPGRSNRRLTTISRRSYWCPSPNYVWHLDGTHKLVRWRFIVHAAIDGYSRLVTFCHCSNNNKEETVLTLFKKAEALYGSPLRVRTDHGVENVRVWEYVLEKRENTNAVTVGSSVHNQRIERLHRDVNTQVLNHFYNEFSSLEDAGLLDPLDEGDLFCLHLVYLASINEKLKEFQDVHNHHSLSTEHNSTPLQRFHLDYRLFHLQALDPSGSLDINEIVRHSQNNIMVPAITPPSVSIARSLLGVVQRNMNCNAYSLYCACARFLRSGAV